MFAEKMGYIEINNSQIIPVKQEIEKLTLIPKN